MSHTGAAYLPLHGGWAPTWLVKRMKSLAHNITLVMVEDLGRKEFLKRISDPCWFQAFGCVLGFDWHSSGVTTVVTAVLKNAVDPSETGLAVCGGKGAKSKLTPDEICRAGDMLGLSTRKLDELVYASRMGAKVDNAAIQAGYPLYHHSFLLTEDGDWAIVQQGLNTRTRMARRYHWLSDGVKEFVVEPHNAIVGKKEDRVLNMTAKESDGCRRSSVDIVKGDPKKIKKDLAFIREKSQKSLQEWCGQKVLVMPWNINWKVLEQAYNAQPKNYEELLSMQGIGPATVKGLALISELIYDESPSWRDPVKYSFAFGGKDGVPFPVRRKEMDEATEFLRVAIMNAKLDGKERMAVLRRLKEFTGND
jgi:hypothetical protein